MFQKNKISDFYYADVSPNASNKIYSSEQKLVNKFDRRPKISVCFEYNNDYCIVIPQFTYHKLENKIKYKNHNFAFLLDKEGKERYLDIGQMIFVLKIEIKKSCRQDLIKLTEIKNNFDVFETKISKTLDIANNNQKFKDYH